MGGNAAASCCSWLVPPENEFLSFFHLCRYLAEISWKIMIPHVAKRSYPHEIRKKDHLIHFPEELHFSDLLGNEFFLCIDLYQKLRGNAVTGDWNQFWIH